MFVIILIIAILTLIAAAQLDDWQMGRTHRHTPAEYETGIQVSAWDTLDEEKARDAQVKPFSGIRIG